MWRHGDESTNDSDGHHFLRHAKELIYDSSASSYRSRSDQSGRRDDQFFYFGYDARRASGRPIQGEVGTIGLETIRIRKKVLKDFRLVVGGDVLAIT